jgi:hypothetical protein
MLLVVALTPCLALPLGLGGLPTDLSAASAALTETATAWETLARARGAAQASGRAEVLTHREAAAAAEHELRARRALDAAAARLYPRARLAASPEDLLADPELAAALQAPPGPTGSDGLAELALVDMETQEALKTRGGAARGPLATSLPDLAEIWTRERLPAAWSPPGWHWLRLGASRYALAARLAPAAPTQPPTAVAESDPPPPPLEPLARNLASQTRRLERTTWLLALLTPCLALLLALCGAWWLGLQVLNPLRRLALVAHQACTQPATVAPLAEGEVGALGDLAGSLDRLAERMRRHEELEHELASVATQALALKASLEHAASGRLGLHAPSLPGPLGEVAQALNRMLDATAERLTGLGRAAAELNASARRLEEMASGLAEGLQPDLEQAPDPAALADLVAVQLDGMGAQMERLLQLSARSVPAGESDTPAKLEATLAAVRTGFRIVQDRIADVLAERERVASLRLQAETLATNLAIAAEAQSRSQLERLGEDARSLARAVSELAESLADALGLLSTVTGRIESSFGQAVGLVEHASRGIQDRLEAGQAERQLAREVEPRLPGLRASVAGLGGEVRRLLKACDRGRDQRVRVHAGLLGLARAAQAQAAAANAWIGIAERFDTGGPAPAEVTRQLAEQQHALRGALLELEAVAAGAGVQALTGEARAILESIQTMAEEARRRLAGDPRSEETAGPGGPPGPGAQA